MSGGCQTLIAFIHGFFVVHFNIILQVSFLFLPPPPFFFFVLHASSEGIQRKDYTVLSNTEHDKYGALYLFFFYIMINRIVNLIK